MDAFSLLDIAAACLAMLATWVAYLLVEHRRGKR